LRTELPEDEAEKQASAALTEPWDRYKETIMGRVDMLDQAAVAVLEASLDDDLRRKAEDEAHKLVGSVGTFGFGEGSEMARKIEYLLQGVSPMSQGQILRLSELAVALRRELEQPPTGWVPEQPPMGQGLEPTPKDDEVLIKVQAASVNPLDWHFLRGTPLLVTW
jgi:HPt (histidine-containing phosphotransfer) domain-containing protein